MTLIEMMVSVVVLTVCVSLLSSTITSTITHSAANRERTRAAEAAMNVVEDMRNVPFRELFASFNLDPEDDPRGPGTALGALFAVPGLTPRTDDQDGFVGRVVLPAEGRVLREDVELPALGMPRDLDGDHVVDAKDHAADYVVLPVLIQIEWTGKLGPRRFELTTMFADFTPR